MQCLALWLKKVSTGIVLQNRTDHVNNRTAVFNQGQLTIAFSNGIGV
uniref:Uncharacterized protein n=1 Tax=Anguilla anguilla TaxID=7936 RepID=A0A0E9VJI0_ANGAN